MSTASAMKQCGDCAHWFRVKQNQPRLINLAAPQVGECRLEPPTLMAPLLEKSPQGPRLVGTIVAYKNLTSDFPACSHHTPRPDNGTHDGLTITLAQPNP